MVKTSEYRVLNCVKICVERIPLVVSNRHTNRSYALTLWEIFLDGIGNIEGSILSTIVDINKTFYIKMLCKVMLGIFVGGTQIYSIIHFHLYGVCINRIETLSVLNGRITQGNTQASERQTED